MTVSRQCKLRLRMQYPCYTAANDYYSHLKSCRVHEVALDISSHSDQRTTDWPFRGADATYRDGAWRQQCMKQASSCVQGAKGTFDPKGERQTSPLRCDIVNRGNRNPTHDLNLRRAKNENVMLYSIQPRFSAMYPVSSLLSLLMMVSRVQDVEGLELAHNVSV